jgi:hypothetical protein
MTDQPIIATRITLDEYLEHCAGKTEYLNGKIMVDGTELFVAVEDPEVIAARRVTEEEADEYLADIELIDGKLMARSGVELFVGIKEFPEAIKALQEEEREREREKEL